MSDKRNPEPAKALSLRIFTVSEGTRDTFISWYVQYTKEIYTLKFIMWRMRKLKRLGVTDF
jgi:hypothetical protein